jgi:hypothetical protein
MDTGRYDIQDTLHRRRNPAQFSVATLDVDRKRELKRQQQQLQTGLLTDDAAVE